jgi:hypothetical protein
MAMKQDFANQLSAQSDIWNAQLEDFRERLQTIGQKGRTETENAIGQMQAKAEEARKLAERVRSANEAAWKDMVAASQKAFVELQRGWADAASRFR